MDFDFDTALPSAAGGPDQFPTNHCHGLAEELHTITGQPHAHDPAASRRLVSDKILLAEPLRPVWGEATVRRAGHRVLRNARGGGEKTGHEVISRRGRAAGDDHSAGWHASPDVPCRARVARTISSTGDLDDDIHAVLANGDRLDAEGVEQTLGRGDRRRRAPPESRARSSLPVGRRSAGRCGSGTEPARPVRGAPRSRGRGRWRASRGRRGRPRSPA